MQISKKDKKLLIVLIIFLAGMAYYEFALIPLSKMNANAQTSLINKRKQLLIVRTKLAGLANYKKKINDLKEVIAISVNNSNMPNITERLNDKMKAVTSAATKASVKISSLKPMNFVSENEDGTVQTIKDKYISINGQSDINSFMDFLKNLWGTELEEIEVSREGKDGTLLRFYIKITFLPKMLDNIAVNRSVKDTDVNFRIKHNVFSPVKAPVLPRTRLKLKPLPPPKPIHQLNNTTLLGIAEFGEKMMAVIQDGVKKETDFFHVGDKYRDAKISKITNKSVVFVYPDGDTLTLRLPEEKKYYSVASEQNKRKGRLGILAETFNEELARQYHVPFRPGLLVISSGAHGNVFQKGDVITSINGQLISNFEGALDIMKSVYAGEELKIILFRHGRRMNVSYKAD